MSKIFQSNQYSFVLEYNKQLLDVQQQPVNIGSSVSSSIHSLTLNTCHSHSSTYSFFFDIYTYSSFHFLFTLLSTHNHSSCLLLGLHFSLSISLSSSILDQCLYYTPTYSFHLTTNHTHLTFYTQLNNQVYTFLLILLSSLVYNLLNHQLSQ